ncbi:MAG: serine hydrolase domain-containing protein [Maricaulaceae bacterium]|jgi:CubicO group peptidase (beta-lactamase class C family)
MASIVSTARPAPARRWRGLLSAGALTLLAGCASVGGLFASAHDPAWPAAEAADPTALGFSAGGLTALDARMAQSVADQDVKGMVTLLARDGEVAQFRTYGERSDGEPMTEDTIFRIYSMSKPLTGVAMMQLYEQGLWDLDDPVTLHAPELANLMVYVGDDADGAPIIEPVSRPPTMRELMSHTAGFGYGLSGDDPVNTAFRDQGVLASADLDELMEKVSGIPLLFEPGERWYYSVAVDVQGYLVQKLSGQRFGDYMQEHVFGPLEMNDTAFYVAAEDVDRFADVYRWDADEERLIANPEREDRPGFTDPNRLESGGGGLVSTTHDYARFCQMMLNRGSLGGARVLNPETVDLMAQNHIGDLRLYSDGTLENPGLPGVGFGLDFAVHIDTAESEAPYGHGTYYWGGAAGTWFWIDPVNDLFFIGMIQSMGGRRPDAMNFREASAELVYDALVEDGGM